MDNGIRWSGAYKVVDCSREEEQVHQDIGHLLNNVEIRHDSDSSTRKGWREEERSRIHIGALYRRDFQLCVCVSVW